MKVGKSIEKGMVLVTGGTGLVGSHLLYRLTQTEERVRALRRRNSDIGLTEKIFRFYFENPEKYLSKIEWFEGDILDPDSLWPALENISRVYHTAALVSFDPADRLRVWETNVEGTANVVNACLEKKIKKLVYVSSVAALGRGGNDKTITETTEWKSGRKRSAYALSKYEAEREVWRGMAEGLNVAVVNPAVILGPGNFRKGSAKIFRTVYNGLKVYTEGVNGYVDADDVAKAMILLMESKISGERFILNSENMSYKELFEMIAAALNVKPPKHKAGKRLSELTWRILKLRYFLTGKKPLITKETAETANSIYRYSNQKFVKATGMTFTPLRDTVRRTAEFFLQQQA